jgi:hypothetical protein
MRRTLVAVAFIALAAGCGKAPATSGVASVNGTKTSSQASASPTGSVDPEERGRKFAQCMRDHGVDMPDPDPGGSGGINIKIPKGTDRAKVDKAMESCRNQSAPGEKRPSITAEQQDQLRAYAQCMRDHGVDMPDPDFSNGQARIMIGGRGSKMKPDDPTLKKAQEACKDKLVKLKGPRG